MKELSRRVSNIAPSMTLAVNDKAKAMQAQGIDVIALAGGDPDFDTPEHITHALFAAVEAGHTHYPAPMIGIPDTLQAIANKMRQENNIPVDDPRHQIIVTPGGKWGLYLALCALLNPGDEVMILEPHWVSYRAMITLAGGTPVAVSLPSEDNFRITAELLAEKVSSKTKAILVNSPCNPTGRVLTQEELNILADFAITEDIYVISDEIYEKLVFDGRSHISIASLPGMAERTLTINGLTKSYAMTGWRMGWLVGPPNIIKVATKMNSQTVSCAATFTMHACAAALNGPQTAVYEMRDSYQERRDFMVAALNQINGVACRSIEGTFYLFPSFPNSNRNSLELADALLEKAQIAGTPGIAFGQSGEGHVRFAISTAMSDLERAVERLAKVAHEL